MGIVLLQLGGPDSLESVEPFLYNLFCDPDIIDLPLAFLFRRMLAGIIARRRAPRVREIYARIGGRSPILKLTARQAMASFSRSSSLRICPRACSAHGPSLSSLA